MKRDPQGKYTKELREEVVKLVLEEELSVPEVAGRLSLPPSTLGSWVKAYKASKLGDVGKMYRSLTENRDGTGKNKEEKCRAQDGA